MKLSPSMNGRGLFQFIGFGSRSGCQMKTQEMNSKYIGNSLDLMKFDLLTFLVKGSNGLGLFYVPMLTEPKPKERNPKYETFEVGSHNETLLKLMKKEYAKEYSDIKVIKKYFIGSGIHLSMLAPMDNKKAVYFEDETRKEYFTEAINHYKSLVNPTLVYIDPDVGSDIGISRRFRSNRSMYIMKHELISFQQCLRKDGTLCYFQHLGDPNYTIAERVKDLHVAFGDLVLFVAYTRIQAAFVFLFNDEQAYRNQRKLIELYCKQYEHLKHKDKLIIIQGKPLQPGGFSAL